MGTVVIENEVIPSSPEDLKKISDGVDELVVVLEKKALLDQTFSDILSRIHDDLKISKKWLRNAANNRFKNDFDETVHKQDTYEIFFEKIQQIKEKKESV